MSNRIRMTAVGFLGGCFGSMAGVGGGVIMVPLLTYSGRVFGGATVKSLSQHAAHGTSLAAVAMTGAAGGLTYAYQGHVDWYTVAAVSATAMLTAGVGAHCTKYMSAKLLKHSMGIYLCCIG